MNLCTCIQSIITSRNDVLLPVEVGLLRSLPLKEIPNKKDIQYVNSNIFSQKWLYSMMKDWISLHIIRLSMCANLRFSTNPKLVSFVRCVFLAYYFVRSLDDYLLCKIAMLNYSSQGKESCRTERECRIYVQYPQSSFVQRQTCKLSVFYKCRFHDVVFKVFVV